jgi:hypothetical protein
MLLFDYILRFNEEDVKKNLNKHEKKVIDPEYVGPRILNEDTKNLELLFPII